MSIIVVGHKVPDTDSMASAIALADLLSKRGMQAEPFAQGKPTPETEFILKKSGFSAPAILGSVAGKKVFLVDHSDLAQSPDDLKEADLQGIVDHHKLGDVTSTKPLTIWSWPVGCSCTVIKNMFDFYHVEITRNIAMLMLSAILSDTLILRSPTTTPEDEKAVAELARIAEVDDFRAYGMEIFTVKSAVDGVPARDLLFRDYKDFSMNGRKVGVGQLEVIDLNLLGAAKKDLAAAVRNAKAEGRHTVILLMTDIMKNGSEMLWASDESDLAEKLFGVKGVEPVWLPGVMSRKKDVIPKLEALFNKLVR